MPPNLADATRIPAARPIIGGKNEPPAGPSATRSALRDASFVGSSGTTRWHAEPGTPTAG